MQSDLDDGSAFYLQKVDGMCAINATAAAIIAPSSGKHDTV